MKKAMANISTWLNDLTDLLKAIKESPHKHLIEKLAKNFILDFC